MEGIDDILKVLLVTASKTFLDLLEDSSSSSDDSGAEDLETFSLVGSVPESHPRHSGYMQVAFNYSDADFWRHFRVTRATLAFLLDFMKTEKFRADKVFHGGFDPMDNLEVLLISLQYIGNQGAIRLLADKFDRTESSIWNAIRQTCQFFFEKQSHFIQFPSRPQLRSVAQRFKVRSGFPGVISAIDGCYIPFRPTSGEQKPYRNYKKSTSFVLMAAVLPDRTFSYIFTGYPGSAHDSTIFQRSSLFEQLENNCRAKFNPDRYHIIGDAAFPVKSWLIPAYKKPAHGALTPSQTRFNYKHSQTRIVVEHAFGDLKNRFRRCQSVHTTIENGVNIVVTSCVIHNICIQHGDIVIANRTPALIHCNVNPNILDGLPNVRDPGNVKRDRIRAGFEPRHLRAFAGR